MRYIDWQNLVKLAGVVGTGYDMVDVGIHCVVVEVSTVSYLLHLCMSLVGFHWLDWWLIHIVVDSRGSLVVDGLLIRVDGLLIRINSRGILGGDGLLLVRVCLGTLFDVDRNPVGYP